MLHLPISTGILYAIPFLIALMIIVFIHELGHFLVARWCGVSVEAFSIGFGKEITGWVDRHGTRWKLSWIPLGGYVKFKGDANAASMPDAGAVTQAKNDPGNFHGKPIWQRAAVVAAGPIANFILAIAIFSAAFMLVGSPVTSRASMRFCPAVPPSRPASRRAISSSRSRVARSRISPTCSRPSSRGRARNWPLSSIGTASGLNWLLCRR